MTTFRPSSGELRIGQAIKRLQRKIENIETFSGRSRRTVQLRDEVARLEALQVYAEVKRRIARDW